MINSQIPIDFSADQNDIVTLNSSVKIDNYFPENHANLLSKQESFNKHLFRPNTYLHKWWARRAGSTFRYILKQLVPDKKLQDYYTSGGLEGVTILDPMMGGGTTLHEAIRLGANVIGYDIDPIPVLQARATLADIEPHTKIQVFNKFFNHLKNKTKDYYKTKCPICSNESEIQYTLYGIRKRYNNREYLIVDSLTIKETNNGSNIYLTDFFENKKISKGKDTWKILDKELAKELKINGKDNDILEDAFYKRYFPLLILGYCEEHGQFYKSLTKEDFSLLDIIDKSLDNIKAPNNKLFEIHPGPKSKDLLVRNIESYIELFTPRQLLFLYHSREVLNEIPDEHRIWLSLLISTSLEFNSILCGYKGAEKRRPGAIRHVFSHHAYSFPYTSLENNPVFSNSTSGTLRRLFNSRILAASKWAHSPVERYNKNGIWVKRELFNESDIGNECKSIREFDGKSKMFIVDQQDSSHLTLPNQSVDFVVTDPPYYDSVQYSDLSHFFRCWLQWFLPTDANWEYLTNKSAVAVTEKEGNQYCKTLTQIWSECKRVLIRPHGRLIFTYHHWKPNAWAQLSIALKRAGFQLISFYVVHSENPISVHIKNLKALKHDTILVLQPDDESLEKSWEKIDSINSTESRTFCIDCSKLLGWILSNDISENEIYEIWENRIKV
jgi:adenine-specific DNA methylase